MHKSDRIYIAPPKRGQLPRRYRVPTRMTYQQRLRVLSGLLLVGSLFWLVLWWLL